MLLFFSVVYFFFFHFLILLFIYSCWFEQRSSPYTRLFTKFPSLTYNQCFVKSNGEIGSVDVSTVDVVIELELTRCLEGSDGGKIKWSRTYLVITKTSIPINNIMITQCALILHGKCFSNDMFGYNFLLLCYKSVLYNSRCITP